MRKNLLLLLPIALSACQLYPTPDGYGMNFGGKGSYERTKNGSVRNIWDGTESFRDGAIAGGLVASYGQNVLLGRAKETTSQVGLRTSAATTINGQNTAADVAKHVSTQDTIRATTLPH